MPIWTLLAGCTGDDPVDPDPASDYALTLTPVLLAGQRDDLLALEPHVKVRITSPDGEHEVHFAGTAREGEELDLTELPPLDAGTVIGLIGEVPGGPREQWNRSATVAYGEVTLDEELAEGGTELELTVPWMRVEAVGRLGALPSEDRRVAAAIVRLPGPQGEILVFGGGDPETTLTFIDPEDGLPYTLRSSRTVLGLERDENGAWTGSMVEVGTLPATWHGMSGPNDPMGYVSANLAYPSATAVDIDGEPWVFVAGGRHTTDHTSFHNPYWFLFDPRTGEVPGGGLPDEGSPDRPSAEPGCVSENTCGLLAYGRSEHAAIPLGKNRVLLYGGMVGLGISNNTSFEVFDASTREVLTSGSLFDAAPLYVAASRLGNRAVVCGGGRALDLELETWGPTDRCLRFQPGGEYADIAPLPQPLMGAALAELPDGGLLVSGGIAVSVDENTTTAASAAAWRWNPETDAWTPVGDLVNARAFHRALPLADGRVLVIGGMATPGLLFHWGLDPIRCAEAFDPDTDTFRVTDCSPPGSGTRPAVGGDPVTGWAVLEGAQGAFFAYEGGAAFGVVGGQPLE